ncbi:MAG: hypothetical protein WCB04_14340 [Mycobacteriales bacterium]
MRRTTALGLMVGMLAVFMPASVLAPSAQAAPAPAAPAAAPPAAATLAANLPAGRANYIVTMMGGVNGAMYSKLSKYLFSADGTVTQYYYYWRQDMISGYSNAAKWKVYTGYVTSGCRYGCTVRTPLGFQPGTSPNAVTGTWKIDAYGHLYVQWSSTAHETYRMDSSQAGFTAITIMRNYSTGAIQKGWGVGSNANPNTGVSMGSVFASNQIMGPMAVNYYGVPTSYYANQSFYYGNYSRCTNGTCLMSNQNTGADKRQWYNSYFAGNPATDGRKVYWQSQNGSVAQSENPGTSCIGYGGGHTSAALQLIDDNGRFIGLLGAEASFDHRSYLQDEVGAWAAVLPVMVKTFSTLA